MIAASVAKVWELVLILTELKSCLIQFTHTKQRGTVKEDWIAGPALLVSGGAVLFFLSDTLLAWNRFVTPLPNAKLQVRVTYHSGQLLIVLGAFLHFI
jgi:hypothetical protein